MKNLDEMIENILEIVEDCIILEKESSEGILNHVKTVIQVYNNEYGIEEPAIWMVQHPLTLETQENIEEIILNFPIEFACVEYDPEPKIAEKKARKLASKVALAIKKNYRRIQYDKFEDRIIENVKFNTLYPVGLDIPVEGKQEKVPVAGIVLDFEFTVDWIDQC